MFIWIIFHQPLLSDMPWKTLNFRKLQTFFPKDFFWAWYAWQNVLINKTLPTRNFFSFSWYKLRKLLWRIYSSYKCYSFLNRKNGSPRFKSVSVAPWIVGKIFGNIFTKMIFFFFFFLNTYIKWRDNICQHKRIKQMQM